jgi:PHD/YefM family antitoxin component YafN of YafNO toxin-antitoxin module
MKMLKVHKNYLINGKGEKKAVVVPFSEWHKIKEALEELDDIRAYDNAKSKPSKPVLFDEAIKKIRKRKSR